MITNDHSTILSRQRKSERQSEILTSNAVTSDIQKFNDSSVKLRPANNGNAEALRKSA